MADDSNDQTTDTDIRTFTAKQERQIAAVNVLPPRGQDIYRGMRQTGTSHDVALDFARRGVKPGTTPVGLFAGTLAPVSRKPPVKKVEPPPPPPSPRVKPIDPRIEASRLRVERTKALSDFKVPGGWDLAAALRGGITTNQLRQFGFTPKDVVDAQSRAADVGVRDRAVAAINRKAPDAITGNTIVLQDAIRNSVTGSELRRAGYQVSQQEYNRIRQEMADRITALEVMAPYESGFPKKGKYELTRALLTRDPDVIKAAKILFSEESLERVFRTHRRLGRFIKGIPDPTPPTVTPKAPPKLSPDLTAALAIAIPVATAEPTPIGELVILAAVGSYAAYLAWKRSRGERVLPEIKGIRGEFKARTGREIQSGDIGVSTGLATPKKFVEVKIDTELPGARQASALPTLEGARQAPDLPKLEGAREAKPLPTLRGARQAPPLPGLEGAKIADPLPSLMIVAAAVAEAEAEVGAVIKPRVLTPAELDRLWSVPSESALAGLDRAITEAAQEGRITEDEVRQYRRARNNYLAKLGLLDAAASSHVANRIPDLSPMKVDEAIAFSIAKYLPMMQTLQRTATQAATQAYTQALAQGQTATQAQAAARTAAQAAVRTATNAATGTAAQAITRTVVRTAVITAATSTATTTATDTTTDITTTDTPTTTTTTGMPPIPIPFGGMSEDKARDMVKRSGGAITWRMGQVGGKDRWDVIINPGSRNARYIMILGSPPQGATVVRRGKGSASATAQMLRGSPPARPVRVDSGIMDITVTPKGGRMLHLKFKPDPQQRTTGDITIGSGKSILKKNRGRVKPGRSINVGDGIVMNTRTGRSRLRLS